MSMQSQINAANQYRAYRHGWIHGSSKRALDLLHTAHPDRLIADAYQQGYVDGQRSRDAALERALGIYGGSRLRAP